ncbi:maltase-glucoamylase, intestinal [Scyliorhinus canicula]|uniref:maltase-glucoamylase, intestinal n=1 Tax=Scyliorhinus canicula TaxID=7830 RepID=UPI0018F37794|nr:maltase-glucoamylase, intestinal [Scyliorhinus canicula]XP_038672625.1 maltase-glucoamylase, intestinal [Scyliorhinus canicula]
MARRTFSALEIMLIVLFILMVIVAIALIVLLATNKPCTSDKDTTQPFTPFCPFTIQDNDRTNCYPEDGASREGCEARGCCWKPVTVGNGPWCFFALNIGYKMQESQKKTQAGFETLLHRLPSPSIYGNDTERLLLTAEIQTANRFRFKITDADKRRFEVLHESIKPFGGPAASNPNYEVELNENPFGIIIRRKSTRTVLFDTSVAPLQFADQYLQITAKLPSHNIYGLGEHVHKHYRHDTNWKTWPIFTRDAFPNGEMHNLYGHHTFFMCLEGESGLAFGVFLLNSNAMEVELQPSPSITYRTIGGVLDFYIFVGSSPEDVVREYLTLVGKPLMPAYWTLGFQLSRWGYKNLSDVEATVKRNRDINLPYDVQITDIDYMEDKKDFTYDLVNFQNLPEFAQDLHNHGQRYIIILDPAISTQKLINGPYEAYDKGTQMGVWVNESDGKTPLLGEVWPGETVFPDYTNPQCIKWWVEECVKFYQKIKYDGLWIDMNEVSSFKKGSIKGCVKNQWNYPPFIPRILDKLMYSKTLCMDAKQTGGMHYDLHSLYGHSMILATEQVLNTVFPGNRSIILSRSTFAGSGKYTGHWLGDNAANWNDIKWAIPGMLEFGLFGFPYIGADICGFFDDSPEELCRRWMQVGAFYPFSRNHNAEGYKHQDPASYGENSLLVNSSKHYLNIRYTLLPYLYTLFHRANVYGDTVVRPLFHEFPSDNSTWTVDRQFLWGPALLITPVLDPGTEYVSAYVPDAVWYDYETGVAIPSRKQMVNMHVPGDKLGLHVRGGFIFPTQQPAKTTFYSRKNPMGLLIALDEKGKASGELFWDDGESRDTFQKEAYTAYQFTVAKNRLDITVLKQGYIDPNNLKFGEIRILGVKSALASVTVKHGSNVTTLSPQNINYNAKTKIVQLTGLQLELGESYSVQWNSAVFERIDCHPEKNANATICIERGCKWLKSSVPSEPHCFYEGDNGYLLNSVKRITQRGNGMRAEIRRNTAHPESYKGQTPTVEFLQVDVTYLSDNMLNFKISDPRTKRFEVPIQLNIPSSKPGDGSTRLYEVTFTNCPFGIQVRRKSTGAIIWNSQVPGFTFTDQFIQISTQLPSQYIYGFGETEHQSFKHKMNGQTWGMFAKDQPPGDKMNCYGSQPFYMGLENDFNAHGVLLLNSNAMDVTLQPTPSLTYRTIGGILDFYMVLGPNPENVVEQYTSLIGRPVMPPYWALGFQLCRYGYTNTSEIEDLYTDMRNAEIPYDVQYVDIDYMERQLDFTLDVDDFQDLPHLFNKMRNEGMRTIVILDPAISGNETKSYKAFTTGVNNDVFIKWNGSSDIVWGKVWPDFPNVTVNTSKDWDYQVEHYRSYAAFPDFFRKETAEWWHTAIKEYYSKRLTFDGLWIDMNEPASFVHGSVNGCYDIKLNKPPYMPALESSHMGLQHKTLCMESEQLLADGTPVRHYDVHNLYGWSQTKPTLQSLQNITGERGIVVTRSTFPSSGQWAGHWLGDNTAAWDQMHKSIIGMMEFSLFGISYTGADICGFFKNSTYELCLRWMQLGAFYPYSRNHNGLGFMRQDPVAWDEKFQNISRNILRIRYKLLPYLYTLMYEAHSQGSTVIRPLLHEFFEDKKTWTIDRQFLWGGALMISPALIKGVTTVHAYVPDTRWYDWFTAKTIPQRGKWIYMPTPLDHINLHIRGGYIIPWQEPANTTYYSRKNHLGLIVALDDNQVAKGRLFWDDGQSIDTIERKEYFQAEFSAVKDTMKTTILHNNLKSTANELKLGYLQVWGTGTIPPTSVIVTYENTIHNISSFHYRPESQELFVEMTDKPFYIDKPLEILWKTTP